MDLKIMAQALRSIAETWVEMGEQEDTETDRGRGYASAQRNHGKTINDLLDQCDVPQLEPESTE